MNEPLAEQSLGDRALAATTSHGARVHIERVTRHQGPIPGIAGFVIDSPRAGAESEGYGLNVQGWVLGSDGPLDRVELRCRGVLVGSMVVETERADVGDAHPGIGWSSTAGFRGRLSTIRLPASFDLQIDVHAGGARRTIASVQGRRVTPCEVGHHLLQPVVLTTLGRSGSTWVTRLLGQHPAVSAYRPFVYEPRAAGYWYSMLAELSEPASFSQLLRADHLNRGWWIGPEESRLPEPQPEPVLDWLDRSQVEALLPLCLAQVEEFYRRSASIQGEPDVLHFVEKFTFNSFLPPLVCDLYPRGVEVILVRDFRDMIVSMTDYSHRRGMLGFGRNQVSSDEEFIKWWRGGAKAVVDEWKARSDTAYLLRYEDLILHPVDTLTSLFAFVGVDAEDGTAERVIERSLALTPEAQRFHMTSRDASSSIGRWARELPAPLQAAARETFDDLLAELGYET